MSSGNDQRIRHVAIVLQSLDAATARQLLSQLPPQIARQVKHAMVNLGAISAQERATATDSVGGLLGSMPGYSPAPLASTTTKLGTREASPASELLALQSSPQIDQVAFSRTSTSYPSTNSLASDSQRARIGTNEYNTPSSSNSHSNLLHTLSPRALADILIGERPIVIATVLNQIPLQRAIEIVQLLPLPIGSATLAILPNLHHSDPEVLKDIQSEIHRKIGVHQSQPAVDSEGLAKLHAIVSGLPVELQSDWTHAIARSNPELASPLGWKTNNDAREPMAHEPYHAPDTSIHSHRDDTQVLTMKMERTPTNSAKRASENSARNGLGPTNPMLQLRFEQLSQLSDADFVTVLHGCNPNDILLALSGASKSMLARVETLIPPKDLKRFRARVSNPGTLSLRDVDRAQSRIVEIAEQMQTEGAIDSLDLSSFAVA